ncbi:MAG: hypothetical protein LBB26_01200 [Puniceicoccales bacterium]|nr:hypothetical protein [Puniceicoccales bacterium]
MPVLIGWIFAQDDPELKELFFICLKEHMAFDAAMIWGSGCINFFKGRPTVGRSFSIFFGQQPTVVQCMLVRNVESAVSLFSVIGALSEILLHRDNFRCLLTAITPGTGRDISAVMSAVVSAPESKFDAVFQDRTIRETFFEILAWFLNKPHSTRQIAIVVSVVSSIVLRLDVNGFLSFYQDGQSLDKFIVHILFSPNPFVRKAALEAMKKRDQEQRKCEICRAFSQFVEPLIRQILGMSILLPDDGYELVEGYNLTHVLVGPRNWPCFLKYVLESSRKEIAIFGLHFLVRKDLISTVLREHLADFIGLILLSKNTAVPKQLLCAVLERALGTLAVETVSSYRGIFDELAREALTGKLGCWGLCAIEWLAEMFHAEDIRLQVQTERAGYGPYQFQIDFAMDIVLLLGPDGTLYDPLKVFKEISKAQLNEFTSPIFLKLLALWSKTSYVLNSDIFACLPGLMESIKALVNELLQHAKDCSQDSVFELIKNLFSPVRAVREWVIQELERSFPNEDERRGALSRFVSACQRSDLVCYFFNAVLIGPISLYKDKEQRASEKKERLQLLSTGSFTWEDLRDKLGTRNAADAEADDPDDVEELIAELVQFGQEKYTFENIMKYLADRA